MGYDIISARVAKRERYNKAALSTEGISQFLAYYSLILVTGIDFGLLSNAQANDISHLLLNYLEVAEEGDPTRIANQLYLLTWYLKSKGTNAERLGCLFGLVHPTDVRDLFSEIHSHFKSEISKLTVMLTAARTAILTARMDYSEDSDKENLEDSLDHGIIWNSLKTFERSVANLSSLNCSLKELHGRKSMGIYYTLATDFEAEDCITYLSKHIERFLLEMQILQKLGARDIMDYVDTVAGTRILDTERKDLIEAEIEEIKNEIEKTKQKYALDFENAKRFEAVFSSLVDEKQDEDRKIFEEDHPDLKAEALEEAFEEWQDNLPDDYYDSLGAKDLVDMVELEEAYHKKLDSLNQKLDKAEKRLDKALSSDVAKEYSDIGAIALEKVLLVKAIIIAEQRKVSQIGLPTNFEELTACLTNLNVAQAVKIVLTENETPFSDSEREYLEKI